MRQSENFVQRLQENKQAFDASADWLSLASTGRKSWDRLGASHLDSKLVDFCQFGPLFIIMNGGDDDAGVEGFRKLGVFAFSSLR